MTNESKDVATIRLAFELARADHPRLYDELIRFPKGTKRINRLRVLAYDGLLAQNGPQLVIGSTPQGRTAESGGEEGSGDVTNDMFAPSQAE